MANEPIFFSYSGKDSQFALDLATSFREAGVNIWLDKLDIKAGENWDNQIDRAIQSCHTTLIILSKHSVKSDNVMDEYSYALSLDKKVVLILVEECEIPFRLKRLQYVDFSSNPESGLKSLAEMLELNNDVIKKLEFTFTIQAGRQGIQLGKSKPKNLADNGAAGLSTGDGLLEVKGMPSEGNTDPRGILDNETKGEELFQDYELSNNAKIIKLFFGTDRNIIQKTQNDAITFGSDNSDLTYGICNVSIPSSHKIGEIERPWMNLKILEKETKHITFKDINIEDKNSFVSKFNEDLNSSPSKSALIFIHGFNVSFVNAAMRTAQISYDLKFEGIRSFYSWPSKGKTASYSRDEEAIQLSESKLKEYFHEVFLNSEAENIYLIGHSMGTRVLSNVIGDLIQDNPVFKQKLREIILTAPDINAKKFKDDLVPKFLAHQKTITLYASTQDIALKASRKIHGFSRAGESGKNIVITNGVETIDATGMDTGFLKHSYFGESRSVINDIYNLIVDGKRPDKRMDLSKAESINGQYWKFRK